MSYFVAQIHIWRALPEGDPLITRMIDVWEARLRKATDW